ncbi:UNVERIFIED_CONTAM: hypothetical protein K2H54_017134 [Gekko kuhli]
MLVALTKSVLTLFNRLSGVSVTVAGALYSDERCVQMNISCLYKCFVHMHKKRPVETKTADEFHSNKEKFTILYLGYSCKGAMQENIAFPDPLSERGIPRFSGLLPASWLVGEASPPSSNVAQQRHQHDDVT